jgi:integrase
MKLTKTTVEKLPLPATGQALVWDSELKGFGVRLTPGSRAYIAQSRVGGKTRRVTLGAHGTITADEARKRARKALVSMGDAVDPSEERKRAKALSATLREVSADYMRDRRDLKPSSREMIVKHVDNAFGDWSDRPISRITRDKVATRFRELSEKGPAQANQAFRVLRALWNYARATYRSPDNEPLLPENPVRILSDAKLWNRTRARTRRVPDNRVGIAWNTLQTLREDPAQTATSRTGADIVAFLMLTGARWNEAAALTWDRVNLEEGWWYLPDPKNRNNVTLPLSPAVVEILQDRPRTSEYLFPHRSKDKKSHVGDARGTFAKLSEAVGAKLSAHDLRRTFRAVGGACGIELWKTKLLMNHRLSGDVTLGHYTETSDLRYLADEARTIAEHIQEQGRIAKADNVVPLEARHAR